MKRDTPFIGQMDTPIELYYETVVITSTGERENTIVLIAKLASNMHDKSGSLEEQEKVVHVNKREYLIRYNRQAWENRLQLVVVDNGVKYRIYHATELQRRRFLKLTAQIYE
jgi:hypothetical protein